MMLRTVTKSAISMLPSPFTSALPATASPAIAFRTLTASAISTEPSAFTSPTGTTAPSSIVQVKVLAFS